MHQPKPASGQVPQIVISHMADNSKIYIASLDDQKVIAVDHYKHGNCNFIMGKYGNMLVSISQRHQDKARSSWWILYINAEG